MAQKDAGQKATKKTEGPPDEARQLAQEAIEEMARGNREEAQFVLDEARALDKDAVDEVLKSNKVPQPKASKK
ncbi:MAG TPA: hypothetical protein VGD75_07765 [Bradyrhizobium sp.]